MNKIYLSACDTQAGMIFIYPVDPVKKWKFLYYQIITLTPLNPMLLFPLSHKQNRFVQDLIIAKLMRPLKGLFISFACLKTNPLSGTGKGFVQGPKKGILSGCNSKVQGIRGPQGMLHGHNPFRCPFKIAGAY
jgi:hypothetical protein